MASHSLPRQQSVTHEKLKSLFHYNPETGSWTRLMSISGRSPVGVECGYVCPLGYRSLVVDGKRYRCARLAWFYMTGVWPTKSVDHVDGNPSNDRWENFREATQTQNNANQKLSKRNKCGFKGVRYKINIRKYCAQIRISQKSVHLGSFDTPEEAHAAYMGRAIKEWGDFARSR